MSSVGVINTSSLLYLDLIQSLSRNCENIIWITTRQYHITKTLSWFYLNFIQNSSCFLFWISNKHKNSILTKLLTQYTSQLQNIVRWCKLQIQYFISLYILGCPEILVDIFRSGSSSITCMCVYLSIKTSIFLLVGEYLVFSMFKKEGLSLSNDFQYYTKLWMHFNPQKQEF